MKLTVSLEWGSAQKTETLTVAGLIKVLSRYDGSLPVVATWEGVNCPVQKDNISISKRRCNNSEIKILLLYVDEQF